MKKRVLALSLMLAMSSAASVFAAVPKTLRIGTDPTYPPFESKNAQGQLVGFDIDLANEISKRIDPKCTYVESDFDALIPSLKAKKIDAIISSLSITEKRQEEIAFSEKLYAANARLVAKKGSTLQPTIESL
ncbi:transporter substrate-binding domain-containing protein, partial [Serratia bockelmannii]|nr:transporter substrate-binding domain-containing protein [Serratia bockelmannii]